MTKTTLLCLAAFGCGALHAQSPDRAARPQKVPHFLTIEDETPAAEAPRLLAELLPTGHAAGFSAGDAHADELGMTHVRYQQTYRGIPVDGYGYTVHSTGGRIASISGAFAKTGPDVATAPTVRPEAALAGALRHLGLGEPMWESADAPAGYDKPTGDLVIYHDAATKASRLAYKYDVYTAAPLYRAWVYVDATTGAVLSEDLRIHHADTPLQAVSDYNGTVAVTGDASGGSYRLRQAAMGGGVETYSLNNGTSYAGATDVVDDAADPFDSDRTAVQAHYGAEQTYDYFSSRHGRNSYNGTGGKLLSYVHYSSGYVNAFWDGSRMTYGDGDGASYGPLTSLDIAGHEMTHGVVEFSANLVYQRESGALNESFADIFGEMVEYHATGTNDWQMGTDIGIGRSGAIRSMDNPNAYGDPDTYGGSNWWEPNCGTPRSSNDYCGVHVNSGVQNKWFYILAVGESGTNDLGSGYAVTGLGRERAAAIAYRNLTVYLSANSTFADARVGAIQAARDLYGPGSDEEVQTTNAWYAVGVGPVYGGGGGGTPEACVGTSVSLRLVTDNYASETSWTLRNAAGQTVESGGGYADNATYDIAWDLPAGEYTFTIDDSYGDGICCAYGSGSYTISSGGVTVASGGSFGSSATVAFCTEGSAADTQAPSTPGNVAADNIAETTLSLSWSPSSDNVGVTGYTVYLDGASIGTTAGTGANVTGLTAGTTYTFGVSASDAAGNESGVGTTVATTAAGGTGGGGTTTAVLLESYFETGLDGWIDGGGDCYRYSGSRSFEGQYSMRLRDNSGTASSMTTAAAYDLAGAAGAEVKFYFYAYSMERGEDFWLQYDGGSGWETVATYAAGTDFENNTFYTATATIGAADYALTGDGRFRFRCDASANADQVYIDQVTITRNASAGALSGTPLASAQSCTPLYARSFGDLDLADPDEDAVFAASVSPNPATSAIDFRVSLPGQVSSARLLNATGQLVRALTPEDYDNTIDVSAAAPGLYLIVVETTEGETETLRFVKQ